MKRILSISILFVCYCSLFAQEKSNTSKFNFDFEIVQNTMPLNWDVFGNSVYTATLDSTTVISGKYSTVIDYHGNANEFKAWGFVIPGSYKGKKITLTGYIKTENVANGWAGLWMRIDPNIAFDNMNKNGILGTTDWKKYTITLKLKPEKTKQIIVGGLMSGQGKMWLDDLHLTVDGKDISTLTPFFIKPDENSAEKKEDSNVVKIKLPKPSTECKMSLVEALWERRSVRDYKDTCLTLNEVSQILWAAYGISDSVSWNGYGLHTAPSAGALYPLEIYLVAGNVSGLPAGIYKYHPKGHYLIQEKMGDVRSDLCNAAIKQSMVKFAPASLVYSAIFSRNTNKYGKRGRERYVCMNLGHSGENVYLQATAMGLGTCAIGAFTDSKVSALIGMPKEEEPLYIMPLGKLPE